MKIYDIIILFDLFEKGLTEMSIKCIDNVLTGFISIFIFSIIVFQPWIYFMS